MTAVNLTTRNVGNRLWDALVIGAGPAGTLAARELARRGRQTLLVESKSFPRDKVCGGYLNGRALALLQSVGLEAMGKNLGGKLLSQVEIRSDRQKIRIPVPTGIAISRSTLDSALTQEAMRAGVHFMDATKATVTAKVNSDFRLTRLQQAGDASAKVRSKVVLACDGLNHSSLRELKQFRSRVASHSRIGVGGVVEDTSSYYPNGQVFMTIGRKGYAGITRVEGNKVCLAAALDADFVMQQGAKTAVLQILQDAGTPISESLRHIACNGTPHLTRHTPVLADERLFLLGDAAGYIEPFTGEGMAMACTGAVQIVPFALQAIENWEPHLAFQWKRDYQQTIGSQLKVCRWLTKMLRYPQVVRATLSVLSTYPKLSSSIVKKINTIDLAQAPLDLKGCNL